MATSGTISSATAEAPTRPVGRGGWVYLPEDFARQHPLYGPYGWAWLLLLFLFVGPIILVIQDFRILRWVGPRPELFWVVLIAEVLLAVLCWVTGLRLGRERNDFPRMAYVTAAYGMICALLFFYILIEGLPRDYEDTALFGFLWRAIPIIGWSVYVWRSQRINVTTLKRVTSRDPFLRSQWLSDETPAGGVSQARRRSLFARPFRKVPVVPTRSGEEGMGAVVRSPARDPVPELAPRRPEPRDYVEAESAPEPVSSGAATPIPAPRPGLRRPTAPSSDRYYVPRRATATVLAPESGFGRPAEERLPAPMADRRQRIENALVLDRLRRVQIAHEEGLITEQELRAKRAELLREL